MNRHSLATLVALGAIAFGSAAFADPPQDKTAFAASLGGAFLPSGLDGPGSATAAFLELEVARSVRDKGALRLGFVGAYENTYYQSSANGLLVFRPEVYLASFYGLGGGAGLGYGSFSPKGGYNADHGGSPELAIYAIPMLLRLGARHNFEITLQGGLIDLASFGELEPFYDLSVGFATW